MAAHDPSFAPPSNSRDRYARPRAERFEVTDEEPNDERAAAIRQLELLARLFDSSIPIPGTTFTIGLDGLIGLVPGIGDLVGGAVSSWVIYQSARLGVPKAVLARMVLNMGVDLGLGAVPLVGDLFDLGWKANSKNVALAVTHLKRGGDGSRSPREISALARGAALLLGVALLLMVVATVTLVAWLLKQL
jgi:hypothetical protein